MKLHSTSCVGTKSFDKAVDERWRASGCQPAIGGVVFRQPAKSRNSRRDGDNTTHHQTGSRPDHLAKSAFGILHVYCIGRARYRALPFDADQRSAPDLTATRNNTVDVAHEAAGPRSEESPAQRIRRHHHAGIASAHRAALPVSASAGEQQRPPRPFNRVVFPATNAASAVVLRLIHEVEADNACQHGLTPSATRRSLIIGIGRRVIIGWRRRHDRNYIFAVDRRLYIGRRVISSASAMPASSNGRLSY